MIIMGIDPGTAAIGYGAIKKNTMSNSKQELQIIDFGCIRTSKQLDASERLKKLYQQLNKIIKKINPKIIAVEEIFFFKNLKTAIKVSQARGVILLAASQKKIPVCEYTPLQVKQAVVGYGRAEKKQIQKMVKFILKLKTTPKPDDAADALALAICCAHSTKFNFKNKI